MPIEVCSISGFSKTEGNSVAIKVDDEVVILDMGLAMENYIKHQGDREDMSVAKTYPELLKAQALPDYGLIKDWHDKVVAIVPSHGHLDHVGAIPFAGSLFPNAPVICSPYTAEILKSILWDERIKIPNKIVSMGLNATYKISKNISIEFVSVTHSILHTVMICVHTPYGKVLYANDYKFDRQPIIGKKPNFARMKELGDEGVNLLIVNCLYAHAHEKTPSESVARQMLKDVMIDVDSDKKAMIVTTFSSHLVRLKSIIEMGKKLDRKTVFLGRSLMKYVKAAERINLVDFEKDVQIFRRRDKIEKILRKIEKEGRDKYLIVCTGHQGEPRAILSRISRGEIDFKFQEGDFVVFSCQVIPVEINLKNRKRLEKSLQANGVEIFRDVHVSGHATLEDHKDLFELVRPGAIMPIHAHNEKAIMLADFAKNLGYKKTHIMQDGQRIIL